ncbi:hypothetical protein F53441_2456 [Fusarium austroafricanum]|uniref:DUF6594 domain-containing protein n=1 Tax=Fusarium austroafricanum TaxID=2364996 RepID=A0A8H4KR98_9HYPO|nr:hypothetical protein F53441_2456 [Fusarium austroafricanum]
MSQSRQTETPNAFPHQKVSGLSVVERPFDPPDLECQSAGEDEMDGRMGLSAMQQQDIRSSKTWDEEDADFEKVVDALEKYDRLMLNSNQVLSLDQPGQHFLEGCSRVFREALKGGDASFVDTLSTDWVSIIRPDRLDQLISHIPTTKFGKIMFKPFFKKKESFGKVETTHYYDRAIRFLFFTFFSFIIGVFACAPAAIQSLNVKSAAGEVAVYLVFVITFGWGVQGLIRGFEKLLLTCLAYSGLMANLLRGN